MTGYRKSINVPARNYRFLESDEFSFVVWVCEKDKHLAVQLIERLRRFNSEPVLVIGDEVDSFPEFPGLDFVCLRNSPKSLEYGDKCMFDRWGIALEWMQTPWIIRLDPDNEILKQVRPIDSPWFGYLYSSTWGVGCSGGSSGYSRGTLDALMGCDNVNYRITYLNGDGLPGMADDSLLIRYLSGGLGIEPEPWPSTIADIVFRRNMLESKWMMSHPCIDKPINAHLPRLLIDKGDSDAEQIIQALRSVAFSGIICTENQQPYKAAGFSRLMEPIVVDITAHFKVLTISEGNYHAGIDGPAIGSLSGNFLWNSWFSAKSCLHRKKATFRTLNRQSSDPWDE